MLNGQLFGPRSVGGEASIQSNAMACMLGGFSNRVHRTGFQTATATDSEQLNNRRSAQSLEFFRETLRSQQKEIQKYEIKVC